ncbi:MAG: Gfo/Idh/MocA family oxidoreductase [Anaerolineaceae bacterium]|nr:Gfo/Idh/MocA family oxidoreductase [Anaerolineaceae bacterium]
MEYEPIRVGLIGLGFIGKIHAQAYHSIPFCYKNPKTLAKVSAVLRRKTGSDQDFLESLGSPFVTTDENAFYDQGLDMVDICTPNALHMKQAITALNHKVHLYIEKPLGLNLVHARAIAAAARSAGVLSHTAFMMRFFPGVRQAKAIIASGALGRIYNFRAHYFHNSYMDSQRPTSWRLQHALSGGGALTDLGVHIIDMMRYLLGEASWVQCRTRTFIDQRPDSPGSSKLVPVDVDDWALCTVGLKNGAQGNIEITRLSGGMGNGARMEIFGSQGSVMFDINDPLHCQFYDQKSKQYHTGNLDFPVPEGKNEISDLWPPAKLSLGYFVNAHTACIYDFLQRIRAGRQSLSNFDDAVKTQEILEAAYLSASRNTETISLPLNPDPNQ